MSKLTTAPRKAKAADQWAASPEIDGDRYAIVDDPGHWALFDLPEGEPGPMAFDPSRLAFQEIPAAPAALADSARHETPAGERISLTEWIRRQADAYRDLDTEAGDVVAETLESLARGFARVGARTVEQWRDRWAAIEAEAR